MMIMCLKTNDSFAATGWGGEKRMVRLLLRWWWCWGWASSSLSLLTLLIFIYLHHFSSSHSSLSLSTFLLPFFVPLTLFLLLLIHVFFSFPENFLSWLLSIHRNIICAADPDVTFCRRENFSSLLVIISVKNFLFRHFSSSRMMFSDGEKEKKWVLMWCDVCLMCKKVNGRFMLLLFLLLVIFFIWLAFLFGEEE